MILTLLIDGDTFAHAASHAPANQSDIAVAMVRKVQRELNADRSIICLSDPSRKYFRHDLWPAYKSSPNRKPSPECLPAVLAALATEFPSRWLPGLEGDDIAGILATCGLDGATIVVGRDNDLRGIPGIIFDHTTGETATVSNDDADRFHFLKTLTGEPSGDNFPGCPGIGPVNAEKIIRQACSIGDPARWQRSVWLAVCEAFRAKGMNEADALKQARIARVLQARNYDIPSRQLIPWEPPV